MGSDVDCNLSVDLRCIQTLHGVVPILNEALHLLGVKSHPAGLSGANKSHLRSLIDRYNYLRFSFQNYSIQEINKLLMEWERYRTETLPKIKCWIIQMAGNIESEMMIAEIKKMIRVKKVTSRLPHIKKLRQQSALIKVLMD